MTIAIMMIIIVIQNNMMTININSYNGNSNGNASANANACHHHSPIYTKYDRDKGKGCLIIVKHILHIGWHLSCTSTIWMKHPRLIVHYRLREMRSTGMEWKAVANIIQRKVHFPKYDILFKITNQHTSNSLKHNLNIPFLHLNYSIATKAYMIIMTLGESNHTIQYTTLHSQSKFLDNGLHAFLISLYPSIHKSSLSIDSSIDYVLPFWCG